MILKMTEIKRINERPLKVFISIKGINLMLLALKAALTSSGMSFPYLLSIRASIFCSSGVSLSDFWYKGYNPR